MVAMNKADVWEKESTNDNMNVKLRTMELVEELRKGLRKAEVPCKVNPYYISVLDSNHPGFFQLKGALAELCIGDQ